MEESLTFNGKVIIVDFSISSSDSSSMPFNDDLILVGLSFDEVVI